MVYANLFMRSLLIFTISSGMKASLCFVIVFLFQSFYNLTKLLANVIHMLMLRNVCVYLYIRVMVFVWFLLAFANCFLHECIYIRANVCIWFSWLQTEIVGKNLECEIIYGWVKRPWCLRSRHTKPFEFYCLVCADTFSLYLFNVALR